MFSKKEPEKNAPSEVTATKELKKSKKESPKKLAESEKSQTKLSLSNPLFVEVLSIGTLALSLFFMLSIYTSNRAGAIGNGISALTKGLFGIGAYLIPIIMIFVAAYILLSEKKTFSVMQISLSTFLFIIIISFFHVVSVPNMPLYEGLGELIVSNYTNGSFSNGGLFGAIFGLFFLTVLGRLGTYVLFLSGGIVASVILSGNSFIAFIKDLHKLIHQKLDSLKEKQIEKPTKPKPIREERTIKTTSLRHKKVKVYDTPMVVGKAKAFDYLVDDVVEHSSDEEEIHIIERGKKVTRENVRKLKRDVVITPKPASTAHESENEEKKELRKVLKEQIKQETALIQAAIAPLSEPEHEPEEEPKEIKPEIFVLSNANAKLNFDIILEDDPEDEPSEEEEESFEVESEEGREEESFDEKPFQSEPEDEWFEEEEEEEETEEEIEEIEEDDFDVNFVEAKKTKVLQELPKPPQIEYQFPSLEYLKPNPNAGNIVSKSQILDNSKKLEETLKSFGVEAKVIEVSQGPAVTRYELSPGQGVKVSKISGLADDLALNLAASGIRIEAPIPGKAAVGIEVPNKEVQTVFLREVIGVEDFAKFPSNLAFALGKDIAGNTVVADIAKMPHLLIAGSTGSGKSVCINTLITSIIYKSSPDEVKLLMVDPKVVELSVYNGIPHLLIPVVTDAKKAAGALNWAVKEMVERYNSFAETSVRDLKGYNQYLIENGEQPLPQIVIIVDELADLMMVAQNEVEDAICRLAQMARAAGLHLVIATQRPSVDVITGLIKANVPSRIAFSVSSGTDSRTILDMTGAEKLLGKGDMLFYPAGISKPLRVQGAFISDKEVESIVGFLKQNNPNTYDAEMVEQITSSGKNNSDGISGDSDEFFADAVDFIIQKEKASVSMFQRRFRIGYNRAARLMEELEERGFVDAGDGSKPRNVTVSALEWDDYKERNGL